MDRPPYSAAWLARWRQEITDVVGVMLLAFEETHGFGQGDNRVRVADEDERRAARDLAREPLVFDDLLTFYESIGEVALADVGNGYFIHTARDVLRRLSEEGAVFVPEADDPHGMVIGSDGGGHLFVADWGGAIHRTRTASLDAEEFDRVADDLPEFLDLLRGAVVRFAETGEPGLS
ncbi:SMI1/KNR4 family protein [Streptomyces sp. NBC_00102]|uniref:SMI1/KNR4 family protein n=1 Tax=Streptomyces sp. NBC_00102 TaxID=2975652 RepID=UPI00224F3938|nr:SMI1/KNR4 family protein [Streptomyces sp. NBC_00102]MCX5396444.1 SMI1/KNR4 family protein [Streptomyces sp. NBC_00102]